MRCFCCDTDDEEVRLHQIDIDIAALPSCPTCWLVMFDADQTIYRQLKRQGDRSRKVSAATTNPR